MNPRLSARPDMLDAIVSPRFPTAPGGLWIITPL